MSFHCSTVSTKINALVIPCNINIFYNMNVFLFSSSCSLDSFLFSNYDANVNNKSINEDVDSVKQNVQEEVEFGAVKEGQIKESLLMNVIECEFLKLFFLQEDTRDFIQHVYNFSTVKIDENDLKSNEKYEETDKKKVKHIINENDEPNDKAKEKKKSLLDQYLDNELQKIQQKTFGNFFFPVSSFSSSSLSFLSSSFSLNSCSLTSVLSNSTATSTPTSSSTFPFISSVSTSSISSSKLNNKNESVAFSTSSATSFANLYYNFLTSNSNNNNNNNSNKNEINSVNNNNTFLTLSNNAQDFSPVNRKLQLDLLSPRRRYLGTVSPLNFVSFSSFTSYSSSFLCSKHSCSISVFSSSSSTSKEIEKKEIKVEEKKAKRQEKEEKSNEIINMKRFVTCDDEKHNDNNTSENNNQLTNTKHTFSFLSSKAFKEKKKKKEDKTTYYPKKKIIGVEAKSKLTKSNNNSGRIKKKIGFGYNFSTKHKNNEINKCFLQKNNDYIEKNNVNHEINNNNESNTTECKFYNILKNNENKKNSEKEINKTCLKKDGGSRLNDDLFSLFAVTNNNANTSRKSTNDDILLDKSLNHINIIKNIFEKYESMEMNVLQFEEEIVNKLLDFGIYFSHTLFAKVDINHKGKVTFEDFKEYWLTNNLILPAEDINIKSSKVISFLIVKESLNIPNLSMHSPHNFFKILKQKENEFIEMNDFEPWLQELLIRHPCMSFLQQHVEFSLRYRDTIISRIFYDLDKDNTGQLSSHEICLSVLPHVWCSIDEHVNLIVLQQYFSYEHFYVLYCTFNELDHDQDMLLDKDDFIKYDNHAMSLLCADRIWSQIAMKFTAPSENLMSFNDWIWFLISYEDMTSDRAIEFWFRIIDLDGDGCIREHEMCTFYDIQMDRLSSYSIDDVKIDDFICQMNDAIRPRSEGQFTLSDFKKNRKYAAYFFGSLVSIRKWIQYENRDAHAERHEAETFPGCSSWDIFCKVRYEVIPFENEEEENELSQMNDQNS